MNKIETLIKELCPNGVEWKSLGESCEIANSGRKPVKSSLRESGDIPYYGANNIQDYVNGYTHDGDYILIAEDGSASLENYSVQRVKGKFWANNHVHVIRGKDKVINGFLFHYFKYMNFSAYLTGGTRAKLTKGKLIEIKIPIPPLEIQEEIVKILDKFTDYVTELTTELTLRQKQYNYYREKLFTFEDEVKKINLSELSHYIKSGKNSVRNIVGNYPVYASTGQIGFSDSYEYNHSQILVARVGAYAGKVYTATGKYDVTDNTLMISVDNNKINFQYLYYYLVNFGLNKLAKGAGQPLITGKQLKELKVPVPSIESQKEIVMFLDKLDIVSNDLNAGLPKEIELRQKQYEFYRDKLLSFD